MWFFQKIRSASDLKFKKPSSWNSSCSTSIADILSDLAPAIKNRSSSPSSSSSSPLIFLALKISAARAELSPRPVQTGPFGDRPSVCASFRIESNHPRRLQQFPRQSGVWLVAIWPHSASPNAAGGLPKPVDCFSYICLYCLAFFAGLNAFIVMKLPTSVPMQFEVRREERVCVCVCSMPNALGNHQQNLCFKFFHRTDPQLTLRQ